MIQHFCGSHLEWGCWWSRQERWRDWKRKRLTAGSRRPSTDTVRSPCADSTSSHTPDSDRLRPETLLHNCMFCRYQYFVEIYFFIGFLSLGNGKHVIFLYGSSYILYLMKIIASYSLHMQIYITFHMPRQSDARQRLEQVKQWSKTITTDGKLFKEQCLKIWQESSAPLRQ